MELFSHDGGQFLLRWFHYLAGVTWIGLLYYFNFVQGAWFKETDGNSKSAATQQLVPRALWWFRWGAMLTFLTGFTILTDKFHAGGTALFATSYGVFIMTGSTLGTLMFLNVWLIIWPNQKIVIASATEAAKGGKANPDAAKSAAKAGLASRTNVMFSVPMLFFMGAASHLPMQINPETCGTAAIVLGVIILALEVNAIRGKLGPLESIKGVIHCGLALTAVLYGVIAFFG
jgi:uncharacterized membrane protein